jgi:hypothetical protein
MLHNDLKKDAINKFGINIEHQTLSWSNFRSMGAGIFSPIINPFLLYLHIRSSHAPEI